MIKAALAAAGAPPDLVQIVTGYGEAGNAVVTGGVDKVIFVGSTVVGKKVMAAAAETLTPVVLELGGKDAFIVCDDADVDSVSIGSLLGLKLGSELMCFLCVNRPSICLRLVSDCSNFSQGCVPKQWSELRWWREVLHPTQVYHEAFSYLEAPQWLYGLVAHLS